MVVLAAIGLIVTYCWARDLFGLHVQAYPRYGSEKKGLPTTYYLTIAETHIYMHSELEKVELLCVNDPTAMLSPS